MKKLYICGVAASLNKRDSAGDLFTENVEFIKNYTTPMFYNHKGSIADSSYNEDYRPVGSVHDHKIAHGGLYISASIVINTPETENLSDMIKSEIVTGLSTGIYIMQMNRPIKGQSDISRCVLEEVSICPFPMENNCRIISWSDTEIPLSDII